MGFAKKPATAAAGYVKPEIDQTAVPKAPSKNNPFKALFDKLGEAKRNADYAPRLTVADIVRDENETADNNVNWKTWKKAAYLIEINSVEMVVPEKPGSSMFAKVKAHVHSNNFAEGEADFGIGETPEGEVEHCFWTSDMKKFANQTADFVSAVHNVHLKDPDPSDPRSPLVVRLGMEMVGEDQPLAGKFVVALVSAKRANKPGKEGSKTEGKFGVYVDVAWYPVTVERAEDGTIVSAELAADARDG